MKKRVHLGASVGLVASLALMSQSMGVQAKTPTYHQSPFLTSIKGLPRLQDRLPQDPKVINDEPSSDLKYQIGTYGGTLRTVTNQAGWDADVFVMDDQALLNAPGIIGKTITGNILKGYSATPDDKTFTFYMRKGMKWSDGYPVTVRDIEFAFNDVLMNKKLTPSLPQYLRDGGLPNGAGPKLEVVNQYEFKLVYPKPYGDLPVALAIQGWRGYTDLLKPFHYLKNYHEKYASAAQLKAEEKAAHVKDWVKLYTMKDVTNWNLTQPQAIGFPVLYPWMLVKVTKTDEYFQRNPYYWKVDAAGNQLPYIDKIDSQLVQNMNIITMKTISGQVDFNRQDATLNEMPLYRKYQQKSNTVALLSKFHCPDSILLNFNYKDKEWRKVVSDPRFREALNLATNRSDIANEVFYGYASPGTLGAAPYDLAKANKLLNEMGMKKGSDGYRTAPDGKPFVIPFQVAEIDPSIVPFTELVVSDWQKLGLNVTMKTVSSTLWGQEQAADTLQATVAWIHTPLFYQQDWGMGYWAPLWWEYHTSNGKMGQKPPAAVTKFFDLIDKIDTDPPAIASTTDYKKLISSVRKNLWFIQPLEIVDQPLVVNSDLGNVTEKGYAIGVNFAGEELYYKHPSQHTGG